MNTRAHTSSARPLIERFAGSCTRRLVTRSAHVDEARVDRSSGAQSNFNGVHAANVGDGPEAFLCSTQSGSMILVEPDETTERPVVFDNFMHSFDRLLMQIALQARF